MNTEEAFAICRMAKGAFPATNMDEFTPEAWSLALEDDRFVDAREALKQLMREQPFIHVSEIVQRIRKIRNHRVLVYGQFNPPPELDPDDHAGYREWYIRTRTAIADGDLVNDNPQLAPGPKGPWSEEQERAVSDAQFRRLRDEIRRREPESEQPDLTGLVAALPNPPPRSPAAGSKDGE